MGSMIRPLLAIAISILPGPVHALIIADDTILDLQEFALLAACPLVTRRRAGRPNERPRRLTTPGP